ncbi:MAG: TonB-dependent receptor [Alphaproteobacteria bacterium PA4]|nr:MAG: TonB-dependent receptor [Alphaproteobacteria bacterium PA4]
MTSRHSTIRRHLIASSALVAALAAPAAALAAEAADDAALSEIVVTASRRSEAARDVPVAVSVISGEKLDAINSSGLDIRFLSARVPSLNVESSFGRTFPRFYIRGLGNPDFDPNAAQPVSVVYDDVALESPMLKSAPIFDVANVQVLRGPQGTLFGRNTPAGVVKIDSVKPGAELNGYGNISWGTYNTVNAEAAIGTQLGGGFSIRASGLLQRRDDWVTNTATTGLADKQLEGYRDLAGRLQLGYTSGDFNALLNVHARDLDGTPRVFRAGIIQKGTNDFTPGFDRKKVALDGLTSQSLSSFGANLRLDYHFDGVGTLYSVTAYEKTNVESTGDIDGGNVYRFPPLGLNIALFDVNTGGRTKPKEFSQELRFQTDDMGGFRAQFGAYYFHQTLDYNEYAYFLNSKTSYQDIIHNNTNENFGLFVSGEYKVNDAFTLRGGLRYSKDNKTDKVSGFTAGFALTPGITLPVTTKTDGDNLSWDLSTTYVVSPNVNFYARVATGYLGPAIQDRVLFGSVPTTAKAQTTLSGEAGIKTENDDKTLRFDLAGYWNRTKNIQLTAVGGTSNSARLLNAAKAVGYGLEAEFAARPTPELELTASTSYNFTEIRDPAVAVGACGSGQCTVLDPLNKAGLAIIDGNDLPQAPRFVGNFTVRYAVPVGSGEVFAFTDWAYRSSVNFFLYEATEFRGKSSFEGGLRVGYKTDKGLEAAVFARNITNQTRIVSGIDFNNLTGMINEPRIIGVQLGGRF